MIIMTFGTYKEMKDFLDVNETVKVGIYLVKSDEFYNKKTSEFYINADKSIQRLGTNTQIINPNIF